LYIAPQQGVAMLAPRKKLWSTPMAIVDEAIKITGVTASDVVVDIGCGDGRFLIAAAKQTGG
jgi:tRNA G46 methylase TrmB